MKLEVDQRTEHMTDSALDCRADGGRHAWKRFSECARSAASRITRRTGSIIIVRECRNCGTERQDEYAYPSLILVKRRMVYPDGYLTQKGDGRIAGDVARAAQLARLLNGGKR